MPRLKKSELKPFPLDYARNVDLIPVLSLQSAIDEQLHLDNELAFFKGRVSEKERGEAGVAPLMPVRMDRRTGLGIRIRAGPETGQAAVFEWGQLIPDARDPERLKFKEILDDIIAELGESMTPDLVFTDMTSIHKPPSKIEVLEDPLDGVNELYQISKTKGYRNHIGASIPCMHVQREIKAELLEKGIITSMHDMSVKRIHGILLTSCILPDNDQGWGVFNREQAHVLQRMLRKDRFWQDTAVPTPLEVDGTSHDYGFSLWLETRKKRLGLNDWDFGI